MDLDDGGYDIPSISLACNTIKERGTGEKGWGGAYRKRVPKQAESKSLLFRGSGSADVI